MKSIFFTFSFFRYVGFLHVVSFGGICFMMLHLTARWCYLATMAITPSSNHEHIFLYGYLHLNKRDEAYKLGRLITTILGLNSHGVHYCLRKVTRLMNFFVRLKKAIKKKKNSRVKSKTSRTKAQN